MLWIDSLYDDTYIVSMSHTHSKTPDTVNCIHFIKPRPYNLFSLLPCTFKSLKNEFDTDGPIHRRIVVIPTFVDVKSRSTYAFVVLPFFSFLSRFFTGMSFWRTQSPPLVNKQTREPDLVIILRCFFCDDKRLWREGDDSCQVKKRLEIEGKWHRTPAWSVCNVNRWTIYMRTMCSLYV